MAFAVALAAFIAMAALAGFILYNDTNNLLVLQQRLSEQSAVLTSLGENYTLLSTQFTILHGQYIGLYDQFAALQAEHLALQASFNNLTQIAHLQKNQTIVSGATLNIPKNSYESIMVQTSYPGYIQVQFSANTTVSIMLTNYKYLTTIDYPVSGSQISSGSFKLPVLDGINYLEIYSPTASAATVTITIILFY